MSVPDGSGSAVGSEDTVLSQGKIYDGNKFLKIRIPTLKKLNTYIYVAYHQLKNPIKTSLYQF